MGAELLFLAMSLCSMAALVRPWIGLAGYFGFAILMPQYIWSWDPSVAHFPFQKYLAAATVAGFLLNGLVGNRLRGVPFWSCAALAGFFVWCLISATQSINPATTWHFLDIFWKIAFMTILAAVLLNSPKRLVITAWVLVIAQGYNAYLINKGYFEIGFSRAVWGGWGGTDNNGYSLITIPIVALSASLAYYAPRLWLKLLAGGIFLLQAHQIMLLESRGAMLACVLLGLLFVWLVPKDRWSMTMIIGGLIAVAILAGPSVVKEFSSSFGGSEELDSSAASRFDLWRIGAIITAQDPILGAGPDCGRYLVPEYYPREDVVNGQKALHNLFLEITTGMGIPALILFLLFVLPVWWKCYRLMARRDLRDQLPRSLQTTLFAVAIGVPTMLSASMFSSSLQNEAQFILVALGIASLTVANRWLNLPVVVMHEPPRDDDVIDVVDISGSSDSLSADYRRLHSDDGENDRVLN